MNENFQYLEKAVQVLNEQINHLNLKIVFDYNESFIDEEENETKIESLILSLLDENDDGVTIIEHEKVEGFEKFSDFKNYIIEFLKKMDIEITERTNEDNTEYELCSVIEYDVWASKNSQNFLGVFNSRFEALISIQNYFNEIVIEESAGHYKPLSKDFYEESEFDLIIINQIIINQIN